MKILLALIAIIVLTTIYAPFITLTIMSVLLIGRKYILKITANIMLAFVVFSGKLR